MTTHGISDKYYEHAVMRAMNRVCSLRLGSNFGMWPATDKNFYLQLTVEKKCASAFFTKKHLRPYHYSGANFTAVVNCTNLKIEKQIKNTNL